MPDEYFMKTARLGFRCWSEQDLPLAKSLWGDSNVSRLIGGPFSEEQVCDRLRKEIQLQEELGIQYWPMFLMKDGNHVGCAGLRPYGRKHGVLEFGVHLHAKYWQLGLAEEAGRAVIDYAFSKAGATALFAGHHPDNESSRRLLAKLGFQFTHEELYPPTGRVHPSYLIRPL